MLCGVRSSGAPGDRGRTAGGLGVYARWDNLGAVQNDAAFPVDYKTWIASNYISAHAILDLEMALA